MPRKRAESENEAAASGRGKACRAHLCVEQKEQAARKRRSTKKKKGTYLT